MGSIRSCNFDPDEIVFRERLGCSSQKQPLAAADLDLKRCRPPEVSRRIKRRLKVLDPYSITTQISRRVELRERAATHEIDA